jgi:hypothetical protein
MITAFSTPGASCTAQVVYGGATVPVFQGEAQVVPATGAIFWQWRVVSSSTSGMATVTCTYQGATTFGRAIFII